MQDYIRTVKAIEANALQGLTTDPTDVLLSETVQNLEWEIDDDEKMATVDPEKLAECSNLDVRIASSGEPEAIQTILDKYELREIRNNKKLSGRTRLDLSTLSKQVRRWIPL